MRTHLGRFCGYTLTANVLVTTTLAGLYAVANLTSGAFTVTFGKNPAVGTPVTIQQGTRAVVVIDATNGPNTFGDSREEFAPGTVIGFYQAAAPSGWTKLNFNKHRHQDHEWNRRHHWRRASVRFGFYNSRVFGHGWPDVAHVWMAPALQGEKTLLQTLVGCGHVSGLCGAARMAAGS